MLKATIIGNLGKDAVVTTLENQTRIISFSVGVNKKTKDGKITTWINCSRFIEANQTSKIAEYLTKGSMVCVIGEPSIGLYNEKPYMKLRVEEINLLLTKKVEEQIAQQVEQQLDPFAKTDDDVPF